MPVDGMGALQQNAFVQNFMEVKDVLERKNKVNPCIICTARMQKNENFKSIEATHRCLECCEDYCPGCSEVHSIQKITASHHVVKIESDVSNEEIRKMFQVRNCPEHPRKPLDYYCADCKKVICVSCFVENHKSHDCKDVVNVETEIRQTVKNNSTRISSFAGEMASKRSNLQKVKETFLQVISDRKVAILKRDQELKILIEEHKNLVLKELLDIRDKHVKEMDERIEEADRFCTIYQSFEAYCNEIESKGSPSDVCSNVDEINRRGGELDKDHEAYIGRPCPTVDVVFKVTELDNFLETAKNFVGQATDSLSQIESSLICVGTVNSDVPMIPQNVLRVNLHRPNEVSGLASIPVESSKDSIVAVVCANDLYVVGSGVGRNELYRFTASGTWTACTSLAQGRSRHCVAVSDKTLFVFGGFVEADKIVLDTVDAYNTLSSTWEMPGKLMHAVQGAVCVVKGSLAYVFGGLDQDGVVLNHIQMYDIGEKTCDLLDKPIPNPVRFVAAMAWEKYAILLSQRRCLLLDLENKSWEEREHFGPEFHDFAVVCENDRLFLVGGLKSEFDADGNLVKSEYSQYIRCVPVSSIINKTDVDWKIHADIGTPFLAKACDAIWFQV